MRERVRVAAVDLGATSGRVMVAEVGTDRLDLEEVHRFPNAAVSVNGSLQWDILGIHREVLTGLAKAARSGPLDGIGIDSWAVDYGLLDATESLLGNPFSHRDARTDGVAAKVAADVGADVLYDVTGLQQLPFNTVYQLVASRGTPQLEAASTLLLLPDLLGHWLTGRVGAERTNASTTGLYDVRRRDWAYELADRVGVPSAILPPLRAAGDVVGPLLPDVAATIGVSPSTPVVAVGSHDTASAVVAVPTDGTPSAYVSSGTWSLVGLELDAPVLTEAARAADFTNESGVDGTIRFLRNVSGLWVLNECLRQWREAGGSVDLGTLLLAVEDVAPLRTVVDIDDPRLLPPSSPLDPMVGRLDALAREAGGPAPITRAQVVRCVLDSLALAYRCRVRTAAELAGRSVEVVHVVGGGSHNSLLCQLTADACGVPVVAGPAEASALGNVLVQARALGVELPDLAAMRALVRRTHDLRRHEPTDGEGARAAWEVAEARLSTSRP